MMPHVHEPDNLEPIPVPNLILNLLFPWYWDDIVVLSHNSYVLVLSGWVGRLGDEAFNVT